MSNAAIPTPPEEEAPLPKGIHRLCKTIDLSLFARIAIKIAKSLRLRSLPSEQFAQLDASIDHAIQTLASRGFDPRFLSSIAWRINSPMPWALLDMAAALGAPCRPLAGTVHDPATESMLPARQPLSFRSISWIGAASSASCSNAVRRSDPHAEPIRVAAIALRLGLEGQLDALRDAGMDTSCSSYVAGHECGHALWHFHRFSDGIDKRAQSIIRGGPEDVIGMAKELYADAIGALATGLPPEQAAAAVSLWRARCHSNAMPIYRAPAEARAFIDNITASGAFDSSQGAPELADACFAAALSHYSSRPLRHTLPACSGAASWQA